ncbi:DoxX family protein [Nocardia niwae]|uniref:DoxX family protein n=1 Tax=Nocardia niwae TaxID=626084 RepID=UPI003F4CC746
MDRRGRPSRNPDRRGRGHRPALLGPAHPARRSRARLHRLTPRPLLICRGVLRPGATEEEGSRSDERVPLDPARRPRHPVRGCGHPEVHQPRDKLISQLPWVSDVPTPVVRLIGVAELAGGLGMILPDVTGIATVLTPLAATGLAIIMVAAIAVHIRRGEPSATAFNTVLLIGAVLVAWGRFGTYAF